MYTLGDLFIVGDFYATCQLYPASDEIIQLIEPLPYINDMWYEHIDERTGLTRRLSKIFIYFAPIPSFEENWLRLAYFLEDHLVNDYFGTLDDIWSVE